MSRRELSVATPDAAALARPARRTRLVRVVLAAAALAALAGALLEARSLDTEKRTIVPTGSTAVAVVDLSLSVNEGSYVDVRGALQGLVDENAPVGLVVFSDVAYELLPPGTPASELRPVLAALVPRAGGASPTPWTQSFRAGTRISQALELAQTMLDRERVERGSIVLLSDLQTAPDDLAALARTIGELRDREVVVRVIPIGALSDGRLLFGRLLGTDAFVEPAELTGKAATPARTERLSELPVLLVGLALAFFAALALHERLGARLSLGSAT